MQELAPALQLKGLKCCVLKCLKFPFPVLSLISVAVKFYHLWFSCPLQDLDAPCSSGVFPPAATNPSPFS